MGKLTVVIHDRAKVYRQDMFLPRTGVHPPWIRGNTPPLTKIGRNPSVEATRARVGAGGLDELDVPPESNNELVAAGGKRSVTETEDTSECHCHDDLPATEASIAQSLAKVADLEELQFFTHWNTDADVPDDALKITVPLLIKLLEWARETAKDDEALHEMVEMLTRESNGGRVLDMRNYDE